MSFESTISQFDTGMPTGDILKSLRGATGLALYGAGSTGRDLLGALKSKGYSVRCFLDRNARPDQTIDGVPVLHPDHASLTSVRSQTHVIVTIFNPYVDVLPIIRELIAAGWRSAETCVELCQLFSPEIGSRYWMDSYSEYEGRAPEINAVHDLWSDEKSRRLYEAVFEYRRSGDVGELPEKEDFQYFPPDIPRWKTPLRFIDCGAYDGDSWRAIERSKIDVEAITAFEPDEANFQALVVQSQAPYFSQCEIICLPCGVHAETQQLKFTSGLGSASRISADATTPPRKGWRWLLFSRGIVTRGSNAIQCISLDACISRFRPTLIKMDIEGAEYDALTGASGMIASARPGLAICVYHRADHLWSIPLLADKYLGGARHYLRLHAYHALDLVHYVLP